MRGGAMAPDPFADDIRIIINNVRGEVGCCFSDFRMPLHYITIY